MKLDERWLLGECIFGRSPSFIGNQHLLASNVAMRDCHLVVSNQKLTQFPVTEKPEYAGYAVILSQKTPSPLLFKRLYTRTTTLDARIGYGRSW